MEDATGMENEFSITKTQYQKNTFFNNKQIAEKIVGSLNPEKRKELESSAQKICALREQLCELYKNIFARICSGCSGKCCSGSIVPPEQEMLVRLVLSDEPEFPNHDTNYRTPHSDTTPCVFLSKNGCALRHWRPIVCLRYKCTDLKDAMDKETNNQVDEIFKQIDNEMVEFHRLAYSSSRW